jgi:hypothetical protein
MIELPQDRSGRLAELTRILNADLVAALLADLETIIGPPVGSVAEGPAVADVPVVVVVPEVPHGR